MNELSIQKLLEKHPEIAQMIADGQGIDPQSSYQVHGNVDDGAFSAGNALEFESADKEPVKVFLSQPNGVGFGLTNHIADQIQLYLEAHRSVPGTMEPLHLFVVTESGQVVDISKVEHLLRVAEHLPEGAVNVFQELRQALGEKWDDQQVTEHFGPITEQVVDILAQIHNQPIPEEIQAKAPTLYSESMWRIHADKELTAGVIHRHNFAEKKWVTLKQVLHLQNLMVQFEHYTRHRAERIKPLHGDPWFRNAYRMPDGSVAMIDQSRSAYGEPAIDLALAIGDSINSSVIREEDTTGPFLNVARRGLDSYVAKTGDQEVLEMLPVMFAFKTFALSVNNPMLQDPARKRLFATGLGCLTLANAALEKGEQFTFNLDQVPQYTEYGLSILETI